MKKTRKRQHNSDMLTEYDFARGQRGKYAGRYAAGANIVVLHPDVARNFQPWNRSTKH